MKIILSTFAALALSAGIATAANTDGGCDYGQTSASTTEAPVVPVTPAEQSDV